MPDRALGRRPPINAPALRLGAYLTGTLPDNAPAVDHFARVDHWILGGNDRYGDCGPVSVANQRLLVTTYLTGKPQVASQAAIFDLYRRSGNPGFDPATGADDHGVVLQTMAEELTRGGIGGVRALAVARVDHTSFVELRAAISIFGSVLFGVNLETAQQAQTDRHLWDYVPYSGEWGGHAILGGRYREAPDETDVVTWAEVVGMTDAFMDNQLEEAWAVIWPEHLRSAAFVAGLSVADLATDWQALTGTPMLPDRSLLGRIRSFLKEHRC